MDEERERKGKSHILFIVELYIGLRWVTNIYF